MVELKSSLWRFIVIQVERRFNEKEFVDRIRYFFPWFVNILRESEKLALMNDENLDKFLSIEQRIWSSRILRTWIITRSQK